jgi:hypothetical protein
VEWFIRRALFYFAFCSAVITSYAQYIDSYASYEGKGLAFDQEHMLPKRADLHLVAKKLVPEPLRFSSFYEDPFSHKILLYSNNGVKAIDELGQVEPAVKKEENSGGIAEVMPNVGEESMKYVKNFVELEPSYPGKAILLPQRYDFQKTLQALDPHRNFDPVEILKQLNGLGLTTEHSLTTSAGINITVYDRLFINDQDPDKFLVIWCKDNRLFANFLLNSGKWEFEKPKIIHTDITLYGEHGMQLKRDIYGKTEKATLVTELSCIKSGDDYYIGYSLNTWESSEGFSSKIATCHVSLFSGSLEIKRSVQLPQVIATDDKTKIFSSELKMQLVLFRDTLCAVIQSEDSWREKIFVQCFDKNLRVLVYFNYLTNSSQPYGSLVPVVPVDQGFLITYQEKRKNSIAVYTQLITRRGWPQLPVCIYSVPDGGNEYMQGMHVRKDENNRLNYYIKLNEQKGNNSALYHYQLSVDEYMNAVNYELNKDNWKNDKSVQEANLVSEQVNKAIAKKQYAVFTKKTEGSLKRTAWVDSSLTVRKIGFMWDMKTYTMQQNNYYDRTGVIRMVQVMLKTLPDDRSNLKSGIVTVYFNEDGKKFWEMKENDDGTKEYGEREVKSSRLMYRKNLEDPIKAFHESN